MTSQKGISNTNTTDDNILYDDKKDEIEPIPQQEDKTSYYIIPDNTDSNEKINLDSPFIEEEDEGESYLTEQINDEIDIPIDEIEKDRQELEIEKLRRKINVLSNLVNSSKEAKSFALCLDSIFNLEVQFELAWNLTTSKMQYASKVGNTAISLDEKQLDSMYKELSKVRKVTVLLELVRTLGFHSLEERLTDVLLAKEFNLQSPLVSNLDKRQEEVFDKLEKILQDYASKVKDSKI